MGKWKSQPIGLAIISILILILLMACQKPAIETALLTDPPDVPAAIGRRSSAKVIVRLEVQEVVKEISEGVQYTFWTFGGKVPGKFIRVREGDTVEFHLANHPMNKLPHNIDLHAVTGPGGGATSSFTAPGHQSQFTFKALKPGLYVYHCATAPVGMHVANGMYGLIFVQPKEGLPKVDREYYVMQGDFYTQGGFGEKGVQIFSMQKAIDEHPTYVVFNGSVNSLVGDNALKARVGETIRLFVGNGGPNLVSSFHVIGEIFDRVYLEGGTKIIQENVQTTLIPAGGSAIVEFKMDVPGTYILVDHSLLRAFNKGALGMLKTDGVEDKEIYSGKEVDENYIESKASVETTSEKTQVRVELKKNGERLYANNCSMCHQQRGEGIPSVFPPLAKSDYLERLSRQRDRKELISIILKGLSGKIVVNGREYNNVMTPMSGLTDGEIASLLTYVTNSWGNSARVFTVSEIQEAKKDGSSDEVFMKKILEWYSKPASENLRKVGEGKPNFFGVYDLHGLIWEWTEDFNSVFVTADNRQDKDQLKALFCGATGLGADRLNYSAFMRYALRNSLRGHYTLPNLGFRCAYAASGEK